MQKTIVFLLLCSFSIGLYAQDCATMYSYFKEGVTLEYTSYGKKNKVEGKMTQKVTSIEQKGDTLVANFSMTTADAKGTTMGTSTFPMKCHKGVVFVDMRTMIPSQQGMGGQAESADMEIEVTGTDLTFPPDMKPGQTLPDAELQTKIRMGSMQLMSNKYYIKNRKVESRENVTTPAGTFDCLRISYDMEYKLMGTRTMKSVYWYSEKAGMIKSVSYDRKGKEQSRSELTKFTK